MECPCGCFYVGLTKRKKLKERIAPHKYVLRTQNIKYPMAKHYKLSGHTNPNTLKAMVIEVVSQHTRGGDRLKLLLKTGDLWDSQTQCHHLPGPE